MTEETRWAECIDDQGSFGPYQFIRIGGTYPIIRENKNSLLVQVGTGKFDKLNYPKEKFRIIEEIPYVPTQEGDRDTDI